MLSEAFSVTQMPTTAFLAADGEVVAVHSGAYGKASLVAAIDEYLGVKVTATP
ncbi:MAG: hypothetical protein R2695_00620 [Acidimicrobiales bacterium]